MVTFLPVGSQVDTLRPGQGFQSECDEMLTYPVCSKTHCMRVTCLGVVSKTSTIDVKPYRLATDVIIVDQMNSIFQKVSSDEGT